MGIKPAAIALGLNRSASTLSGELHRNGWVRSKARRPPGRPPVAGGYRAQAAHKRAPCLHGQSACCASPAAGTRIMGSGHPLPEAGYSPEQIAGTLMLMNDETPTLRVSHETIYTAIYAMPRGELRTEVIGWLRFGHAQRRPRARCEDRRGQIPDMVSIHDRPPEIEEHWCQVTGRAISSRGRITAQPSVR
jgi:transposase, IS30 family